ncbi:MAG: hypothetical protein SFU85_02400 [Candidatus Methylacidiphilales bacterium]|nr:hypothetical protein [Candidatus Methylacidiphilales bacterium]
MKHMQSAWGRLMARWSALIKKLGRRVAHVLASFHMSSCFVVSHNGKTFRVGLLFTTPFQFKKAVVEGLGKIGCPSGGKVAGAVISGNLESFINQALEDNTMCEEKVVRDLLGSLIAESPDWEYLFKVLARHPYTSKGILASCLLSFRKEGPEVECEVALRLGQILAPDVMSSVASSVGSSVSAHALTLMQNSQPECHWVKALLSAHKTNNASLSANVPGYALKKHPNSGRGGRYLGDDQGR